MTKWVKIEDKPPPDCVDILLYCKEEGILKGIYHETPCGSRIFYTECFNSHREFKPTHWMKIPQPPKDES